MCEVCNHNVINHVGLFTCKSMTKSYVTWSACWTYVNSRSFIKFKFLSTKASEAYLGSCYTAMIECFCENNQQLSPVILFRKHTPSQMFDWVLSTPWSFAQDSKSISSNVNEVIRAVLNSFFLRKDFARTKSTKSTKSTKTQQSKSTKRYKKTVRVWWSHHTNNSTFVYTNKTSFLRPFKKLF